MTNKKNLRIEEIKNHTKKKDICECIGDSETIELGGTQLQKWYKKFKWSEFYKKYISIKYLPDEDDPRYIDYWEKGR